jgi:hypothetical protein
VIHVEAWLMLIVHLAMCDTVRWFIAAIWNNMALDKSYFRSAGEAVAVLTLFWLVRACSGHASDNFDREVWLNASRSEVERRCGMAEDIRMNIARPGMSMEQVRSRLGHPERIEGLKFEYYVGMCCPIDGSTLDLYFGADQRLQTSEIVEH